MPTTDHNPKPRQQIPSANETQANRIRPLSDLISYYEKNGNAQKYGIRKPAITGESYEEIAAIVGEVAASMGLKKPRLIVHSGKMTVMGQDPDYNVLFISDKVLDVLTGKELRWLIAHELEHETPEKRKTTDWHLWSGTVPAFKQIAEFNLEDRANKLYGADAGYNVFNKFMVTSVEENFVLRAQLFNGVVKGVYLLKLTREAIKKRVREFADEAIERANHVNHVLSGRMNISSTNPGNDSKDR